MRKRIHQQLIDELGPVLYDKRLPEQELRRKVHDSLTSALASERAPLSSADRNTLIQEVADDIMGYGPIDRLLNEEAVTEIMVNGPDCVFAERGGKVERDVRRASPTPTICGASSTRSSRRSDGAPTSR
ncbi:MAG: hypothetical protein R2704_09660 [Microthrixaceae bacterium]